MNERLGSRAVEVVDLRVEHRRDALGIGTATPRISWRSKTHLPGWWQSRVEIECAGSERELEHAVVESDESNLVPWPFRPLRSREKVELRVRVEGIDGSASTWSRSLSVEAGLLEPTDWIAGFVSPPIVPEIGDSPAWHLRQTFEVRPRLLSARLYVTALGVYEVEVNGRPVGDEVLAPGWTTYDQRLRYATHDVSGLLDTGQNAIGATIADGWFRGRIGFAGGRWNRWGERTALLAQLELRYADGTSELIITDEAWRASRSEITATSIYDGEAVDGRLASPDWCTPDFDDSAWLPTDMLALDVAHLEAPLGPPVRRIEELSPVAITRSPSGRTLIDFGQNLVGRLRITVEGATGTTIRMRHAEVLEEGELATRPLRFAQATDQYTLHGNGPEVFEPRFTFHGFRYAEVEGWPGEMREEDVRAVVLHSDLERTGWFECSNGPLNQLHRNVVWSMRGNFLDIPTDCPQRDERLGWTGDIQVFSPTAMFLFDASGFLASWLADLAAEQRKLNGIVPPVVPNAVDDPAPVAAWGDAATIVPMVLYERAGDRAKVMDQFESMAAWTDTIAAAAGARRIWSNGFQFGDWLDPTAPPDQPGRARTDPAIVATAYLVRSATLTACAAALIGMTDAEARYDILATETAAAFASEFVTSNGYLASDAETAYALALCFELLPSEELRERAGARLAELVEESGFHVRTGFVGTPLICDALTRSGHLAHAYRLVLQTECPSWLYPVTMGATTIWERWDSMLPDGTINAGEMTSFNHYALGAVADWMHRTIGGLAPGAPGYRIIEVAPQPGGGITRATTRHTSPYGEIGVTWEVVDDLFRLDVDVPPNSRARVRVPGSQEAVEVGSGRTSWIVSSQRAGLV